MLDYINANKFEELLKQINVIDYSKDVIFCSTGIIHHVFNDIKNMNKKFILITHNSDNCVKQSDYMKKPKNVIYWYASNCVYDSPDLIPIPYGLQNEYGYNEGGTYTINLFQENYEKWNDTKKIEDIIYCNWTNGSNPIRPQILSKLDKNGIKYVWQENNVAKGISMGRKEYYDIISTFKFVISPPGNSFDDPTHADCPRTWEILYTGGIPIIIKNNLYKEYGEDFPMIQVNDYSEVTYDLLNSYLNRSFNREKMYMNYWRKRIIKQFNNM